MKFEISFDSQRLAIDLRLARDAVQGPLQLANATSPKSFKILLSTRQYFTSFLANSSKMAYSRSLLHTLCGLLVLFSCTEALKFDLQAFPYRNHKSERCIRNFVSKDTLVVVTATIGGINGDGMVVNMHVGAIGVTNSLYSILTWCYRSKMQLVMSMESRRMLLGRREWHSHRMRIQHLMSASRI